MKDNFIIEALQKFSQEDLDALRNLASQLGSHGTPLNNEDLHEIINSQSTHILITRDIESQKIIAMVTVSVYRIPYVKKSYIDDFVVDEAYRGQGIGSKLFEKALDFARENGAAYVDFTSNPKRIEGNKLYEKLGFKKRDTNVYRLTFDYD